MTDPTISYFNNIAHTKKGMSLTFSDFLEKIKDGLNDNHATELRVKGFYEAKQKGWI